jgi:hypothetical protein
MSVSVPLQRLPDPSTVAQVSGPGRLAARTVGNQNDSLCDVEVGVDISFIPAWFPLLYVTQC